MAGHSEERARTEPKVVTEVTEAHIHNATADLVQLQAGIEELNSHCAILSTMHTGITPFELFESEFVKLDGALAGQAINMPICGGIFKDKNQDKTLIIPWSGTDPDSKINCYSWSKDERKWQIPISQHLSEVELTKCPCHICILWPTIAKHAKLAQDTCVTYKGTKFNGLPKTIKSAHQ